MLDKKIKVASGTKVARPVPLAPTDKSRGKRELAATRRAKNGKPAKSRAPQDVVSRVLAALEFIAEAKGPLTASDLAVGVGIPRASAYRIFSRLEHEQILVPEVGGRGFSAGERLSNFAINALTRSTRHDARHRVLETLVDEIGETCNLTTLYGGNVVYLDRVETDWPLRMHLSRGSRVPAYCTATGKLLLSMLPQHEMEQMIRAAPLRRYSERTITDPNKLIAELARIRIEGIGIDNEEFVAGMVAVAVPVFDRRHQAVAALAVHAPIVRLSLKAARQHVAALRKAAIALSSIL